MLLAIIGHILNARDHQVLIIIILVLPDWVVSGRLHNPAIFAKPGQLLSRLLSIARYYNSTMTRCHQLFRIHTNEKRLLIAFDCDLRSQDSLRFLGFFEVFSLILEFSYLGGHRLDLFLLVSSDRSTLFDVL